jgi:NAD-dependent deacetylase
MSAPRAPTLGRRADVIAGDSLAGVAERLRAGGPILVLTGAGVSAESGLATFRGPGGLWEGRDPMQLATPEAFRADPLTVWRFYAWRRSRAAAARPNAAHRALAALEQARPDSLLVTQNVDGLHERAGSRRLVRLHGSLWRLRCTADGREIEDLRTEIDLPPRCACGALLRPAVVWFGEALPQAELRQAMLAAENAALVLVVGTSSLVFPAAELPRIARAAGAHLVEVNPEPTPLSDEVDERFPLAAGELLPALVGAAGIALEEAR